MDDGLWQSQRHLPARLGQPARFALTNHPLHALFAPIFGLAAASRAGSLNIFDRN